MNSRGIDGQIPRLIPVLDLKPEIEELWDSLQEAMKRVFESGQFILGPEVEAFEREVAAFLGVRHAIGLNSGTDALVIALRALGIGPGDEVITTPFTFFATPESISLVGAEPVFVDVCLDDFNIDPSLIDAAVTERTRAILPVHLFGRPARMDEILEVARRRGLHVVEDCAQSFGARLGDRQMGTLGDVGTFSFFPSKNLGAFGDGGLAVTDDDALADRMRMLRSHGSRRKYENELIGYNSRLDALHAALLRVKLPHVDGWNQGRRLAARRYGDLLSRGPELVAPDVCAGHVFHQYTVRLPGGRRRRDALREALARDGIQTAVYYPTPCHRLPVYQDRGWTAPNAERLAGEVLSLPIWPQIKLCVQEAVAERLTWHSEHAE